MTQTVEPLVKAARDFIQHTRGLLPPKGPAKDALSPKLAPSGPRTVMVALAHCIDANQELMSVDANKPLIARLKGEEGHHLLDIIGDIAMGNGDATKESQLRAALTIRGENLFDALNLAIRSLAVDKHIQLGDNSEHGHGRPDRPSRGQGDEERRDKGTWRESTHDKSRDIPDRDISSSAREYDKTNNPISDKDIAKSAEGENQFRRSDADKNDYERDEDAGTGHQEYFNQQMALAYELREYTRLAQTLKSVFDDTLGKQLPARIGELKR